jgi:hypothetical protein
MLWPVAALPPLAVWGGVDGPPGQAGDHSGCLLGRSSSSGFLGGLCLLEEGAGGCQRGFLGVEEVAVPSGANPSGVGLRIRLDGHETAILGMEKEVTTVHTKFDRAQATCLEGVRVLSLTAQPKKLCSAQHRNWPSGWCLGGTATIIVVII